MLRRTGVLVAVAMALVFESCNDGQEHLSPPERPAAPGDAASSSSSASSGSTGAGGAAALDAGLGDAAASSAASSGGTEVPTAKMDIAHKLLATMSPDSCPSEPPKAAPVPEAEKCWKPSDCALPPSICVDSRWLAYYDDPSCTEGACRYAVQYYDCGCGQCVQDGCRFHSTAG